MGMFTKENDSICEIVSLIVLEHITFEANEMAAMSQVKRLLLGGRLTK